VPGQLFVWTGSPTKLTAGSALCAGIAERIREVPLR
jgi:predicted methyltransferase